MKLQFLNNIDKAGGFFVIDSERLVRLYDFSKDEAVSLISIIQETVIDRRQKLDLAEVEFIELVNCNMILTLTEEDAGISYIGKNTFACGLTASGFEKMITLMKPFTKKSNGYQWLYELDNDIDFLFSPG